MGAYHVTLGGQGLIVDLRSYSRRVAEVFAPRLSTGDRTYDDLTQDQYFVQSDWKGGEGLERWRAPATEEGAAGSDRYRAGENVDVYSVPGALRLGWAGATSLGSTEPGFTAMQVYGGALYAGTTNGKVYRFDGSAWTLAHDTGTGAEVRAMAVFKGKLYVCLLGSPNVYWYDGAAWGLAFTATGATGVGGLAVQVTSGSPAVRLYFAAREEGPEGVLYYWDGSVKSAAVARLVETGPRALAVAEGRVWVAAAQENGEPRGRLYSLPDSGPLRAEAAIYGDWFESALAVGSDLYLGTRSRGELYRYRDGTLELLRGLRPAGGGEVALRHLASWGGALLVAYRPAGGGSVGVLRYDPGLGSWSRPFVVESGATAAGGVWPYGGKLYLGEVGANARVLAADPARWAGSGWVESALFDARLPSVGKVLRGATVRHAPLGAGESVEVHYRLEDAGPWTLLGTSNVPGATEASFTWPAGTVGRVVGLRLGLGGPGTSTPEVRDVVMRYVLAPELKREWTFDALLEGTPELAMARLDGSSEPKTGAELSAALWGLKAQPGPLTLVDLDGQSYEVWLMDLKEVVGELSQRRGYQARARLRLVEA